MDASESFRNSSDTRPGHYDDRGGGGEGVVASELPASVAEQVSIPAADSKRAGKPISPDTNALLKRLYGPIGESLQQVELLLRTEMQSPYEDVASLLRHGIQLGGKRLRPAIHLLMAEAIGNARGVAAGRENVVIGAVLEMIHTATLVHDDVLDEAATRRHVPTINAQWNNHTSILLGDYLFAQSYRLAATLGTTRTCLWVGEAARSVCEGELRQVLGRDDVDIDEATYLEIINGKTAELCRVACSLAAAESGCAPETIDRLADYGTSLGIAFQIADDFLDLWGEDQAVGKTLGTDLEQGKITLPVIRLLATAGQSEREEILAILRGPAEHRASSIRHRLEQSDARDYTFAKAQAHKEAALRSLDCLADSPAKRCLIEIAEFSVKRSF